MVYLVMPFPMNTRVQFVQAVADGSEPRFIRNCCTHTSNIPHRECFARCCSHRNSPRVSAKVSPSYKWRVISVRTNGSLLGGWLALTAADLQRRHVPSVKVSLPLASLFGDGKATPAKRQELILLPVPSRGARDPKARRLGYQASVRGGPTPRAFWRLFTAFFYDPTKSNAVSPERQPRTPHICGAKRISLRTYSAFWLTAGSPQPAQNGQHAGKRLISGGKHGTARRRQRQGGSQPNARPSTESLRLPGR
jgi:hypothetical protein